MVQEAWCLKGRQGLWLLRVLGPPIPQEPIKISSSLGVHRIPEDKHLLYTTALCLQDEVWEPTPVTGPQFPPGCPLADKGKGYLAGVSFRVERKLLP